MEGYFPKSQKQENIGAMLEDIAQLPDLGVFEGDSSASAGFPIRSLEYADDHQLCRYVCVYRGCHSLGFFCEAPGCPCRQPHKDHINLQDSWITVDQLLRLLAAPPAIEKSQLTEEWSAMDQLIDKLFKRLE